MNNYFPHWLNRQCPCCSPGDLYVKLENSKLIFYCVDCGKTLVASGVLLNEHLEQIFDLLVLADKERGAYYEK